MTLPAQQHHGRQRQPENSMEYSDPSPASAAPNLFLRPGEQAQISLHERSQSRSSSESLVSQRDILLEGPHSKASSAYKPHPATIPKAYHPAGRALDVSARRSGADRSALPEPLRLRKDHSNNDSRQRPNWRPSEEPGPARPPTQHQPSVNATFYRKPKDLSKMGLSGDACTAVEQSRAQSGLRPASRGRAIFADVRRLSARLNSTPGDIMWPTEALNKNDNRVSQILGQTARSPGPSELEVSYMDLDSIDESYTKDNGRRARIIALCGFLVTMNTWGLANAFSIFLAYYQTVLLPQHSPDQLSWIGSVQLFLMFFMGAPAGIAIDRGKWFVPFYGGILLLVAGLIGKGFCTRYVQFVVVEGVITGLGMGMLFCSGAIMLMGYFERRVGIAMAFAAMGAGLGSIIHAAIFETITYSSTSRFAWASRGNAFFAIATLVLPAIYVHPHPGMPLVKRSITVDAISDKAFNTVIFGFWWAFLGLYFAFYFLVPYGFKLGMHGPQALQLIVALYIPNLVFRVIAGVVSDCYTGPLNLVIASCFLTAMVTILWIWIASTGGLFAIACFYGIASGGLQALYSATFHSFTFKEPSTMNVKSGLAYTVISFACLIGTPIGGRLVRADDNGFLGAQLFSGVTLFIAALILLIARYLKVQMAAVRI